MPRSPILLVTFFLGCNPDTGVKAFNAEPEAEITSHSDGAEVYEGDVETFRGSVSDPDHPKSELVAIWYLGTEEVCAATAPADDGTTSCDILITDGADEVSLEVRDPQGAAASDILPITVIPTESPEALILTPEEGGVYYSDQKVTFTGIVSDGEDNGDMLVAYWESDIDDVLDVDAIPNADGEVEGAGYLSEGEHYLKLHVEDSTGKTGTASVIIDVGPPNSAPTCEITAPLDGYAVAEGEEILFEGLVDDVDVAEDWLAVVWESDVDGTLRESNPDTDGTVGFSYGDLTVATHRVTMTVTDEVGETCSNSIYVTVGTPPSLIVTAPTSGDVENEGSDVTFVASVSDNEDQPTDLVLSWNSSLDGEFSTQGADSSGNIQFSTDALTTGDHTLTVRATDTDGLYAETSINFTMNATPTAPTVAITPDPAQTEDDLVASAAGSVDPDSSGAVTYSYAWYEDGILSSVSTTATFPRSSTSKDHTYKVIVTPNDGTGDGETGEAEVSVINTAPVLSGPTLSASTVAVGDTLTCSASATDDDASDTLTITYTWSDGSTGSTYTVDADNDPGDTITCTATVDDGDGGTDSGTVSATVQNTDPVMGTVSVSPSTGKVGDTLICSASATDADGDMPTITYAWNDGSTGTTYTIVEGDDPGDTLTCTATATDPDSGSDSGSATATVENTNPVLSTVNVTPSTGKVGDTITCSASATDTDGDTPTITYAWQDGSTGASYTIVEGDDPGDTLTCTATATDPDSGSDSGSATATVENTAPVMGSVSISPSTGKVGNTLTCSASVTDADGNTPTISYVWNDGSIGASYTIDANDDPGDTLTCTATADDGDGGTDSDTASATVDNTDPVMDTVSVSPSTGKVGDTITCSASATDADGNTPTISYAWNDGSSGATYTIDSGDDPGDALTCTATADDGDGGTDSGTATATVTNTDPVLAAVTITPGSANNDDTLTCSSSATDADGDSPTLSYSWTNTTTGSSLGSTSSIDLSTTSAASADTVQCTVTATDPDGGADTAVADLTLDNRAPTVSVTLSPSSGATSDDTLTCSASVGDDDDDSLTTTFTWTVDGATVSPTSSSTLSSTLAGAFVAGNLVACRADTDDGKGGTDTDSASTTITNTPPSVGAVTLSPNPVYTNDTITASTTTSDAEGDALTVTYDWYVDGSSVQNGTSNTLSGVDFFDKDQDVYVIVTADDGSDTSSETSSTLAVSNTPPTAPVIAINPVDPTEGEDLTCEVLTDSSDDDGDSVSYTMSWTVDTIDYTSAITTTWTDDTIDGLDTVADEVWECTVTPSDEDADGTTATDSVTIEKKEPVTTSLSLADYTLVGENSGDKAGYSSSNAGDVDGDGLDDILVGAYENDDGGSNAGKAYLILGSSLGSSSTIDLSAADYSFVGESSKEWAGFRVSGVGDVDGDGLDDFLIDAHRNGDGGTSAGKAYLILGSSLGSSSTIDLSAADYSFVGEDGNDFAGYSLSGAGDVDGDGLDDILIGAHGANTSYLILGSSLGSSSTIDLSAADYSFVGENSGDQAGIKVSDAGDVDDDGLDDILIGAYKNDDGGTDAGKAYLILGSSLGSSSTIDLSAADYSFVGENSDDRAGARLSSAGDVDGDGLDDILIGATGNDDGGSAAGKAYLILGSSLGSSSTIDLSAADYSFVGENSGDVAGDEVSNAGDVDGDGLDDILVGAYGNDDGGSAAGKAYLILGSSLGSSSTIDLSAADYSFVGSNSENASRSLSTGDMDGDGLLDLLVGAPNYDGGRVYLILGSSL